MKKYAGQSGKIEMSFFIDNRTGTMKICPEGHHIDLSKPGAAQALENHLRGKLATAEIMDR